MGAKGKGSSQPRSRLAALAGVVSLVACTGGGTPAPTVARSTAGSVHAGAPRVSAGSEVGESDWTATVRPLGEPDESTARALAGQGGAAPAAQPVAQSSASGGSSRRVNPAVVSLLNAANAHSRDGDHSRAAASLERAIAIEPDNAWLWHRLAVTRLAEGRLDQAAGLAAKSNALPGADRGLQADNWRIIAEVRRRQGDADGAAAAKAEARRLAQ